MTFDTSFLSREQLRYIRRSGKCRLFEPHQILPMIDLVISEYEFHQRPGSFSSSPYNKYAHDIHYILMNFPVYEVHSYMTAKDQKFMKNWYSSLESFEIQYEKHQDIAADYREMYDRYQIFKSFIPIINAQMVICG